MSHKWEIGDHDAHCMAVESMKDFDPAQTIAVETDEGEAFLLQDKEVADKIVAGMNSIPRLLSFLKLVADAAPKEIKSTHMTFSIPVLLKATDILELRELLKEYE